MGSGDPHFTFMRNKDWFVGHSWAAGLFEFGDSRNQESTSEAVNAWYAIALYGLATGNDRLKDLGRLALATELRTTQLYWQIDSADDIYPSPYADNKVVGILWGTKVDYATFLLKNDILGGRGRSPAGPEGRAGQSDPANGSPAGF